MQMSGMCVCSRTSGQVIIAVLAVLAVGVCGFPAEPVLVRDIIPGAGSSSPLDLTAVGSQLFFFPASDGSGSYKNLWTSDGTEAGTILVQVLASGSGNGTGSPLAAAGKLFFRAWDNVNSDELWCSNPASGLTVPVMDLSPDVFSGQYTIPVAEYGSYVMFRADNGTNGIEPWFTAGSPGGAVMQEIRAGAASGGGVLAPRDAAVMGGILYFTGETADGVELWRSAYPQVGSTWQVEDIYPGAGGSNPYQLVAAGSVLFFTATTADAGRELWKVVDTLPSVTTSLVKDILPGSGSSEPDGLTVVGDRVFFFADDGTCGRELWVSDGTEVGTTLVKDIRPGAVGSVHGYGDLPETSYAGTKDLFFFAANDGVHGEELWVSDGSEAGTHLTRDIHPGDPTFPPAEMVGIGSELYFRGDDGVTELWVSDGSEAGTLQVSSINASGSYPSALLNVGGNLFFTANQDATGRELWMLSLAIFNDGFESGTTDAWAP